MKTKSHRMPHKARRLAEYILSHIFPANNFATTLQRIAKGSRIQERIALADFANSDLELDEITGLEALGDDSTAIGKKVECMANAIELGPRGEDGFYRLTPYGRHPYGDGGDLQVVDSQASDAIVRRFDLANSLIIRAFSNAFRPVYEGHPDHPVFSAPILISRSLPARPARSFRPSQHSAPTVPGCLQ